MTAVGRDAGSKTTAGKVETRVKTIDPVPTA